MDVQISIYHDRRNKKTDTHPVKLRVYHDGEEKYYYILHQHKKLRLSAADFEKTYNSVNPKGEYRTLRLAIDAGRQRAEDILKEMHSFSFDRFGELFTGTVKTKKDILAYFDAIIAEFKRTDKIRTYRLYGNSKNSFISYIKHLTGTEPQEIPFKTITPDFLRDYQKHMMSKGNSITTVSMYTRNLRRVFNDAISDKACHPDLYPFGKKKKGYRVPAGRNKKKNISPALLKKFFALDLSHDQQAEMARDFWFFSYVCNGMNMKDILSLRRSDIHGKTIRFVRQKSEDTTAEEVTIVVPITDYARKFIERYGNRDTSPDAYIFPMFNNSTNALQRINKLNKFTKLVNKKNKEVAGKIGIDRITTMSARHSFSTNVIRNGQSMEFVQKALGHTDMKTTLNYFAGFEDETLHSVNSKLLDFGEE